MKLYCLESDLERIEKLKKAIIEFQNMYSEGMELTEENINKVTKAIDEINKVFPPHLNYKILGLKMVNSAGTKFTIN